MEGVQKEEKRSGHAVRKTGREKGRRIREGDMQEERKLVKSDGG